MSSFLKKYLHRKSAVVVGGSSSSTARRDQEENDDTLGNETLYSSLSSDMFCGSEIENESRHGGSVPGHEVVQRNRAEGYSRLYADYFADPPVYNHKYFRRR